MTPLRPPVLAVLAAAAALLAACMSRVPEQPPRRILDLSRSLPVVVTSDPGGRAVFAESAGAPGERLGTTPVEIDRLEVTKEIWKHGAEAPPPVDARALAEAGGPPDETAPGPDPGHASGDTLDWAVWIEAAPGGRLERHVLRFSPERLDEAFARGRIELSAGSPAAAAGER